MYVLELACFRAHPQHVAALRNRAAPLIPALRRRFPGLRKLQLGFWDSREGAEAAARDMYDMPEMTDWLAQVDEFSEAA